MHRKIDEDIDLVVADHPRGFAWRQAGHISPDIRKRLQATGNRVGPRDIGVTEDFEVLVIVRREERRREQCLTMVAKIGREVADAEAAIRIANVGMRRDEAPAAGHAARGSGGARCKSPRRQSRANTRG